MRAHAAWAVSSAAVITLLAASGDPALAHPKRRAGLWEVRSASADTLGMAPTRYCVGESTDTADTHLDRSNGPKGSCSLGQFLPAGQGWVAESVCREGKNTVTSRAVATGDFENEYRIDTVVTYTSAAGNRREDREAAVARWLGARERNQRAGDLVIPGMGTLNMGDGTFKAEPAQRARRAPARSDSPAAPRR